jgi:hypothetical protein
VRPLALHLLRALVVVPEVGLAYLLVERPEARFGARDVKDAPEGFRDDAPTPPTALSARSS